MRRAHVYQRSVPRADRLRRAPHDQASTARTIAAQLGHIIDKADQSGLSALRHMLEEARIVAEQTATASFVQPDRPSRDERQP